MKLCCIKNLVDKGFEENFELSPEGERVTCPVCGATQQKIDGRWTEIDKELDA